MKYKSAMMTQASGSVGGMTASRNRGGNYMRARAIPTNPGTSQQTTVRNIMSQLASNWGNILSGAQRTAWETYAANVPLINSLGDPINVSGLNMYVRSNVPALQAGMPHISAAPTTFDLGGFSPVTATVNVATGIVVEFTDTDPWLDEDDSAMLVYNGITQSQTVNYFTGPYRYAGRIDGDAATPLTSPQTVAAAYGVVQDNRTFLRIRVLRADGRLSAVQKLDDLAAAS